MSAIEWLVVIASGLGGFYLISKLIDVDASEKADWRLRNQEPIAGERALKPAVSTPTTLPTNKWNNYIARHWRGELSLPISYWINSFIGNIAIALGVYAIINWADLRKTIFFLKLDC